MTADSHRAGVHGSGHGAAGRAGAERFALVALFCVLWSSAFAAGKIAIGTCPPLTFLAIRFVLAGVLMLGLAAASGRLRLPSLRDVAVLALLGLLNNALYLGLNWSGMKTVSSAFSAIIVSANPLLTAIAAALVLGERLTAVRIAGLLLGMAGVALVMRARLAGGVEAGAGTLLIVLGVLSLVAGTVLFKRLAPRTDLWTGNALQCLFAGLFLAPAALMLEDSASIMAGPAFFGTLAYMVVAVSLGAYWLWFYLLTVSSATVASSLHFLMPPLGLLFGWMVLGEPVALADLAGIVPIAIGIRLVTRPVATPAFRRGR